MDLRRGGAVLARLVLVCALAGQAWASSEKVLYAFHGKDGRAPSSVILGADGSLYGTTWWGGTNACTSFGCGVVFRLTRGANGKWRETVLHKFDGSDGNFPNGSLVADKAGNLYGTTVYGGPNGCSGLGCGVAFELERGGGGQWTFKVLHYFFQTYGDGAQPYAGLIFDSQGNMYGTTSHGGNTSACEGGCGVVFELSPDGKGNWTETVLYAFSAGTDGSNPLDALTFDASGSLYGTAQWGGAYGGGTVFKLTPGPGGNWAEEVLHSFKGGTRDGDEPTYGLIFDSSGDLYGTTTFGGTKGQQGWGTAFKLAPVGSGKWNETILRTFDENKIGGGYVSSGLLLDAQGSLYGTAYSGGKYACPGSGGLGCGVVFKLTRHASGRWGEEVLHSFGRGKDGQFPGGDLVFNSSGHLIGVTVEGGYSRAPCAKRVCGVVFEIAP